MITTLSAAATSNDHWNGLGPWWPIFPLLWFLLIAALIATLAFRGRRRWHGAPTRAGEARLAERFAAGEIDEREYAERLSTLKRLRS